MAELKNDVVRLITFPSGFTTSMLPNTLSLLLKQIGFVWQKSGRNLFPYLTSLENIEAPMLAIHKSAKKRREKAEELLALVGMEHKRDSYPAQMSGGEQQRVAIAVALANEPEILLADEPTGAVDTKTSSNIQDLFRKLNRELGLTIIIVTHDMKLAHKVDRVVMISEVLAASSIRISASREILMQ